LNPNEGKLLIYADMHPCKRGYKNYVLENILKKNLGNDEKYPFFKTKCHSPILLLVLQVYIPEELQDLDC